MKRTNNGLELGPAQYDKPEVHRQNPVAELAQESDTVT